MKFNAVEIHMAARFSIGFVLLLVGLTVSMSTFWEAIVIVAATYVLLSSIIDFVQYLVY